MIQLYWLFLAVLVQFSAGKSLPENLPKWLIHDNVHRQLEMTSQLLREKRAIALTTENAPPSLESAPVDYWILVERSEAVIFVQEKQSGRQLPIVERRFVQRENETQSWLLCRVQLPPGSLQPKEGKSGKDARLILLIDIAYPDALEPHPREIAHSDQQLVRNVPLNLYMPSLYAVKKQRTKVTLATSRVESFTKPKGHSVQKSGKTITYGPYEELVKPLTHHPLQIHYENNVPFLTTEKLQRELWVSHWAGVLAVEEWFHVRHDGARLKHQFSRIDFTQNTPNHHMTTVVKSMTLELPAGVMDPYYRDEIGNVSTSNFRLERKRSWLELRPRYPLFGGWNYNWYHGYNVPLGDFVRYQADEGKYVFQALFYKGLPNSVVEEMTLKVVLPEGASDIKIHLPFDADKLQLTKTHTFLDSTGRPTLLLTKRFVVDEHSVPFQVSYRMPFSDTYQKPMIASAGFLMLFLLSMLYVRSDVAIHHARKLRLSIPKTKAQ